MFDKKDQISRRTFLERSLVGLSGLAIIPAFRGNILRLDDFPKSEYLGRNTVYMPATLAIRTKPSADATAVRIMNEDECVPWLGEVIGEHPIGRIAGNGWKQPRGMYIPQVCRK
jgi:hypothetical protein